MGDKSSSRSAWKTDPNKWPKLKVKARAMRHSPTEVENKLWQALRGRNIGYKFHPQHSIGQFITDFYCSEARLAIEIDGPIHLEQAEEDKDREEFILSNNIKLIRFKNEEILTNLDVVLTKIISAAKSTSPSSPSP